MANSEHTRDELEHIAPVEETSLAVAERANPTDAWNMLLRHDERFALALRRHAQNVAPDDLARQQDVYSGASFVIQALAAQHVLDDFHIKVESPLPDIDLPSTDLQPYE